jgi:hypothetical protein
MTRWGILVGVVAAGTSLAFAGGKAPLAGTYQVEMKEVSNTCPNGGLNLSSKELTIEARDRSKQVKVLFPPAAIMRGSIDRQARVKARARRGGTSIEGLLGEFSVAGSVAEGKLELVLVGQYFASGRPYCVQSWNVTGAKK